MRIFFVFRRGTDQFSADGERLGKAPAVEIDRELRPLGVGIFRIERRRPAERLGRFVEPAEPVQQVGSMQMVLRYLRSDRERPVYRLECILDPTAQHLRCGQQAKRDVVLRVDVERAAYDVGSLVKTPGAQQQLAGVQRVLPITRCQRQGAQGKGHGLLGLFEGEFEARHLPQDSTTAGRNDRRPRQIFDRILISARSLAQAGGVNGEFRRIRIDLAGPAGMKNCAIELSGSGKRPARVTVAFGPSGTDFQQSLVGRRGFCVAPGIAEHPSTQIGYFFLNGPEFEGNSGAFGGMFTPSPVQQGFAEPAIEDREFAVGKFALSKIASAGLNEISGGAQGSGAAYRLFTNLVEIGHCTCFGQVGRLPAINVKDSLVRMKRLASKFRHYIVKNSSIPHELGTIF